MADADDRRKWAIDRVTVGLLALLSVAAGTAVFHVRAGEARAYERDVAMVAEGRAEPVRLVVGTEELVRGDDGEPDEWLIELSDPQVGTLVHRENRIRTTFRTGEQIDGFRCGPADYLIPLFDRSESRRAFWARWFCLAGGALPLVWLLARVAVAKHRPSHLAGISNA